MAGNRPAWTPLCHISFWLRLALISKHIAGRSSSKDTGMGLTQNAELGKPGSKSQLGCSLRRPGKTPVGPRSSHLENGAHWPAAQSVGSVPRPGKPPLNRGACGSPTAELLGGPTSDRKQHQTRRPQGCCHPWNVRPIFIFPADTTEFMNSTASTDQESGALKNSIKGGR